MPIVKAIEPVPPELDPPLAVVLEDGFQQFKLLQRARQFHDVQESPCALVSSASL